MSDVTFAGLKALLGPQPPCKKDNHVHDCGCPSYELQEYAERLEKAFEELREEVDTHVTSERIMSERLTALLGTSEAGKGERG